MKQRVRPSIVCSLSARWVQSKVPILILVLPSCCR